MREKEVYHADDRREIIGRGGALCELREHPDIINKHEKIATSELLAEKPEENKDGKELKDARVVQTLGELGEQGRPEAPVTC